jgi:hypothetical protein
MHQRPNPIHFFFQREMARVEKMELCELSTGVRKSEKVSLCYPIMPIADGIDGRLMHVDRGQLG